MVAKPPQPIRSLREDEPEVEERIEEFIASLGEIIDELQDLEAAEDGSGLARAADALRDTALELGYPALAESAQQVADASADLQPESARKAIVDLTELSQRVRRGHRSAA